MGQGRDGDGAAKKVQGVGLTSDSVEISPLCSAVSATAFAAATVTSTAHLRHCEADERGKIAVVDPLAGAGKV